MEFFDGESNQGLEGSKRFWIAALTFLYVGTALQLYFGEFLLGISNLGLSILFTVMAYENLKEKGSKE